MRKSSFKPGSHKFLLELPPELNLDLYAFCELHFGAPRTEVARRALQTLIEAETSADPKTRQKFEQIRHRLDPGGPRDLRVVRAEAESDNAEKRANERNKSR